MFFNVFPQKFQHLTLVIKWKQTEDVNGHPITGHQGPRGGVEI
jgi:hypothetical protein